MNSTFAGKLKQVFSLDLRSLALFRIGLAWVILTDLILRFGDISIFYSGEGVLPRQVLTEKLLNPWYWSVYLISDRPIVQTLVFAVAILLAFLLLIGYRTRLVIIAVWAMTISLHNRNPALLFAGDDALRAILFWAMFLPLGAAYSVDRALNSSQKPLPKSFCSVATAALMIQLCFIYIFSAFFKHQSPLWSSEGSAVYYALNFDQYATVFDPLLLNLGGLLTPLTFFVLWLEWLAPLIIFIPFRNNFFRCFTIVLFILLHLGFGLFFEIGIFPLLCIFTWLAFLPSSVWDGLARKTATRQRSNLRIYYHHPRDFGSKILHLLTTFLVLPETSLVLTQEPGEHFWFVEDWQQNQYYQWEAVVYLVSLSPLWGFVAFFLRFPPLMSLGKHIYHLFASQPRFVALSTAPLQYRPLIVASSPIINFLSLFLLFLVTIWNFRSFASSHFFVNRPNKTVTLIKRVTNSKTMQNLDWLSRITRLDQSWSIFAPNPPRDDGWHVVVGKLDDGDEINLLYQGDSVNWSKPTIKQRNTLYRNMQWRTYFINLNRAIGKQLYPYYGRYLCQQWNSQHQGKEQLDQVDIYFMKENTLPPQEQFKVEKTQPWSQSCSEEDSI